MIAMMLEEFVETLGYDVRAIAASVAEALDKVREGGFDLAILDCYLNGEEVWPVADRLVETGVPFVLSSGGVSTDLPPAYAACPMLEKPYSIATISQLFASLEASRA